MFGYWSVSNRNIPVSATTTVASTLSFLPYVNTLLHDDYRRTVCRAVAADALGATVGRNFTVTVEEGDDISAGLLALSSIMENVDTTDASSLSAAIGVGTSFLNRANCSDVDDNNYCALMNRHDCTTTTQTCGYCLDYTNYAGEYGHETPPVLI